MLDGSLVCLGTGLSIIKKPKSHKDSFETDGDAAITLGHASRWRWMQRHEVGLGGGWLEQSPSPPRADAPCWQPLGGRAQGDGTSLKAWEKWILLADAQVDRPTGCSPLLQAKDPAAQGSPALATAGLGQSKNRASGMPQPQCSSSLHPDSAQGLSWP